MDVSTLALLHSVLRVQLLVATSLAFVLALVINYSLNHIWSFGAQGRLRRRLLRYFAIVSLNFAITLGLVTGLTSIGLHYLLAKAAALAVATTINFFGYREWVFR